MNAIIIEARRHFHAYLLDNGILSVNNGIASNADKSSKISSKIALRLANQLIAQESKKALGQTAGAKFEEAIMIFLSETFPYLQQLRPGKWHIEKLGNRGTSDMSFVQYEHLDYIAEQTQNDPRLAASLGNDYVVNPDVVIYREPEADEYINNNNKVFVDSTGCTLADIRKINNNHPILHASISAKWTMRSDRAQNSRTEALNLIRNRKGRVPHIVVVTAEPLPARIASLALGTGDIDCVYHFALYELIKAVDESGAEDAAEMLKILVDGKRLKDISDLPLDLCI